MKLVRTYSRKEAISILGQNLKQPHVVCCGKGHFKGLFVSQKMVQKMLRVFTGVNRMNRFRN